MIKLKIIKTNPDWLEATWFEETVTTNEVQEEIDDELQTVQKEDVQTTQIHCESFSGHPEHIQMLKDKCTEFETELSEDDLQILKEISESFVMPTEEEIEANTQAELKNAKSVALMNIVVEVDGMTFDGNESARLNMVSAIQSAELLESTESPWKLADNSVQIVTFEQLKLALALSIQEVGRIVMATSIEEL